LIFSIYLHSLNKTVTTLLSELNITILAKPPQDSMVSTVNDN